MGLRYRDKILDVFMSPYTGAVGEDFLLMNDNARLHRARMVNQYLEDQGLERLSRPAHSPDLNPIEHAWDRRQLSAYPVQPRNLQEIFVQASARNGSI